MSSSLSPAVFWRACLTESDSPVSRVEVDGASLDCRHRPAEERAGDGILAWNRAAYEEDVTGFLRGLRE